MIVRNFYSILVAFALLILVECGTPAAVQDPPDSLRRPATDRAWAQSQLEELRRKAPNDGNIHAYFYRPGAERL